jgi:hypothetical protein
MCLFLPDAVLLVLLLAAALRVAVEGVGDRLLSSQLIKVLGLVMAGAVEPCAALADMVIDSRSPAALSDGSNDDGLPARGDSSGLADTDIVPEDDSAGASPENVSDAHTDDDALEAGSWEFQRQGRISTRTTSPSHQRSHPTKFPTTLSRFLTLRPRARIQSRPS